MPRSRAASAALVIAAGRPAASSAAMPAAVVPPGEVTRSRSAVGLSPVSASSYLAATALAVLPGSFAFTTILGAGLEVLKTHSLDPLFALRPIAGLLVFIAAVLLPPRIKARYFPTMPDAEAERDSG